jgi:ribosome biogenesis GTPase
MTDKGIVIRGHGKLFIVRCKGQEIPCELRGKLKFKTEGQTLVAVGDDVTISVNDDGTGMIEDVAERRSMFFRPDKTGDQKRQVIASNIDQLASISSVKNPDLKIGLIDRFLIAAELGGLIPIVIINKIDLGWTEVLDEIKAGYSSINVPIYFTSAETGEGLDELTESLVDHRTIFAGHSGVGKSSLMNKLIPDLDLKVSEVSAATSKGVHTTSWVEMFELPRGGYLVDSPGLKILKLWEVEKDVLPAYYPEFDDFRDDCKYLPCSHTHEPDCAVKEAASKGIIPRFRYNNYVSIYNSL